jgi:hypothetical protein
MLVWKRKGNDRAHYLNQIRSVRRIGRQLTQRFSIETDIGLAHPRLSVVQAREMFDQRLTPAVPREGFDSCGQSIARQHGFEQHSIYFTIVM